MTRTVGRHRAGRDRAAPRTRPPAEATGEGDPDPGRDTDLATDLLGEPEPAAEAEPVADEPTDADLLARVRGGDTAAFGVLYDRHGAAARRLARVLVRDPSDADDLVAEAFAKVLAALRRGRGPELAFRAYLLTAVRHACYDRARRDHRLELTEDMTRYESADPAGSGGDPSSARLERSYAARAFARLPERWQMVLWHTEVEGEKPATIAPMLGLSPNAVSALAYRARERLRQMYLQEHLHATRNQSCHWTATRLGAHVRSGLPRRESSKVDAHLADCGDCRMLWAELAEVNSGLRGVLAPVVLGTAAAPYLTTVPSLTWWAALAGWWQGLVEAVRGGWSAAVGWGHGQLRRYGPNNVAAGVGLAAAAAVGIGLFALALALAPDRPDPEPPAAAEPGVPAPVPGPETDPAPDQPAPPEPAEPPSGAPAPGGIDAPAAVPGRDASTPAAPTSPASPPASAPPAPDPIDVAPDLSTTTLAAAERGELPITVHLPAAAPESTPAPTSSPEATRTPESVMARPPVELVVELPAGITLAGPDAGDGWRCRAEPTAAVVCERPGWPAGESRTARLPVAVDETQGGFAPVSVTVTAAGQRAATSFRVPVAPAGQRVGYAATGRYRLAMAGNTWLTCAGLPECLRRDPLDNHLVPLQPYLPAGYGGGPVLPPGLVTPALAASGAELAMPADGAVAWAELRWATTGTGGPDQVMLHSPAGGWRPITPDAVRSGTGRPLRQAYADVTGLVRDGGPGPWWLAVGEDTPLPAGKAVSAGWSLTVVYADRAAPRRDLAVFTGPVPLSGDLPALSVGTDTRRGTVEVGLVIWEGDRALTGDTLRLDGRPLGEPGNVAASRAAGALECGGAPVPECGWHTFGVDVARHQGRAVAGPDRGKVILQTTDDLLEMGVLVLAVDAPR